jgi:hypothetical protein
LAVIFFAAADLSAAADAVDRIIDNAEIKIPIRLVIAFPPEQNCRETVVSPAQYAFEIANGRRIYTLLVHQSPAPTDIMQIRNKLKAATRVSQQAWQRWQRRVVTVIRNHLSEVLSDVRQEDIDWDAWRPFFEAGLSPHTAVEAAFLRPLARLRAEVFAVQRHQTA